ncbi:MAG: UxaA family hydrolase, partial [Dehalococcoidales bacterium]|nr:UxaA family hydrolase [Dehalococcoidales bacterium]
MVDFLGFPRSDGSVGARNYVLVIPGGFIAEKICDFVRGVRTVRRSNPGMDQTPRDRETAARTLVGIGMNPNVGAVIVHDGGLTSEYPEFSADAMANAIAATGKPVEVVKAVDEGGTIEAIARGAKVATLLARDISRARRERFGLDKLCLSVKCGWSDPTSGIAGNAVVGYLYDRLVDAGGTALFGETVEVIGAEHLLAKRGATPAVAEGILRAVDAVERVSLDLGVDIRNVNPVPANKEAGLSTLEEKSLGALYKSGWRPISGVLQYGERTPGKGLYFVDNSPTPLSIYPGYAAAGSQLSMWQLGGGGIPNISVLHPSPAPIMPLMWLTANARTNERCRGSIDFYSGTVIEGAESVEEAGERLLALVAEIASG